MHSFHNYVVKRCQKWQSPWCFFVFFLSYVLLYFHNKFSLFWFFPLCVCCALAHIDAIYVCCKLNYYSTHCLTYTRIYAHSTHSHRDRVWLCTVERAKHKFCSLFISRFCFLYSNFKLFIFCVLRISNFRFFFYFLVLFCHRFVCELRRMDSESVNNLESNGHALNGSAQNGVSQINNVAVKLNKTDQDIVRLIGQYLKIVGLG